MKRKTQIALLVFMAAIVGLDQLTKYLTVRGIPMGEQVPLIPGVIHLTYAATVLLIRRGVVTRTAELWSLAAIGGGALGNAIDRLLYGSVIDMIEPEFIDFAVFNVADSFITCGAVVLVIFLLFFDRKKKTA